MLEAVLSEGLVGSWHCSGSNTEYQVQVCILRMRLYWLLALSKTFFQVNGDE